MNEDPTHDGPLPSPEPQARAWRAGVDHAAAVGRLLRDFNAEFNVPCPSAEELSDRFARLLNRDDVIVLVAGGHESPSGFAFLTLRPTPYFDGPIAQLEELYVVPELRDRGIGTSLLQTAVETVRARGAGEVHINVDEIDVDTRRFYERHGFSNIEPSGTTRMLFYIREL